MGGQLLANNPTNAIIRSHEQPTGTAGERQYRKTRNPRRQITSQLIEVQYVEARLVLEVRGTLVFAATFLNCQ